MTTRNKKIANRILSRCLKSCIVILLMFAFILSDVQVVLAQTGFNLSNVLADFNKNNSQKRDTALENNTLGGQGMAIANISIPTLGNGGVIRNTYVLSVATGASPGTQVLYFALRYQDTNNTTRTHYILLSDNELQKSYTEIVNKTVEFPLSKDEGTHIKTRLDAVKAATGYSVPGYPNSIGDSAKPLAANSTNDFVIVTEAPIKAVEEISFFVKSDTSSGAKNEWRCENMRLYKADKIYGLDMYGYYSSSHFLKFDGTEIAAAKTEKGYFNFTWNVDKLLRITNVALADEIAKTAEAAAAKPNASTATKNNATAARISATNATKEPVKLTAGQNIAYSSATPKKVYFELGFEDLAQAGIESLVTTTNANEKTISKMSVAESLVLRIIYKDTFGDDRRVDLPYITSSATWMNDSSPAVAGANIIGLAQQGEALGFVATLPDFDFLKEYKFFYDDVMVKDLGISIPTTAKHTSRLAERKATVDNISLSYFTATDATVATPTVEVVAGVLKIFTASEPQLYYAQKDQIVSLGSSVGTLFKTYQTGIVLEPQDYDNKYIIKITTDDVDAASSTADMSMKLGYIDTSGVYTSTGLYKLKDLVSAFYGYWPGNGTDSAYAAALSTGSTMYGVITLNNVESFDNISITSDGSINDDWQFKKVEIDKVINISKRSVEWTTFKIGNVTLDRRFFRSITSEPIIKSETKVYLKGSGETKELAFGSKSVIEVEDSNWTDNRFVMSYDQAIKNLGFTKSRHVYTVKVKVGNEKGASMSNDDCGSKNLFYFQLIFKGGRSSYVLANQQISSDGFRAGITESFSVATNQNYGDVVSVNIIADDMSSNSDVYDKLKIEEITVTKDSTGGLSRQWGINNVGWVSIDYRDEGESSKKTGRPARSEVELARNYAVTSSAYVMNMLFTMATSINADHVEIGAGEYMNDEGIVIDASGNVKKNQMAQFTGTMMAQLNYLNGAGEPKAITFDVVDAIYQYAYKQPKYLDDFQKGSSTTLNSAVSDPSFMFRKNHTDRFILSVSDMTEIKSIVFLPTSVGTTTWYVNSLSASLIDTDGTLGLNAANEYERNSTIRTITSNDPREKPYDVLCTMGVQQQLNIPFISNNIKVEKIDDEAWSAAVTRVPTTTNDTLNVFIHTNKIAESVAPFTLSSAVKFTDSFGSSAQTASGVMLKKDGETAGEYIYYAIGLSATNMATLNKIKVEANTATLLTNYAKYAIIQRVRAGVLIDTYRVVFPGHNSGVDLEEAPSSGGSATIESETQVVTMQLGKTLEDSLLVKQNRDVAVAIAYTTTVDVRDTVYTSPYIYITDEQYKMITGGNVLSISFKLPYLKEIKGLKIVTTGGLKIPIENAIISTYMTDATTMGQRKLTGWYSFPQKYEANAATETKLPLSKGLKDAEALSHIGIKLVGGKATGIEAGGLSSATQRLDANPLRLIIGYLDENGLPQEAVYEDIRKNKAATKSSELESQSTNDGLSTVTDVPDDVIYASVLLRGMKKLRWIKLEPYDLKTDNVVSTYINEVTTTINSPQEDTTFTNTITQKNRIIEGQDPVMQVNFEKIAITVAGTSFDDATKKMVDFAAVNESINLTTRFEKNIIFTPSIKGSEQSFTVTAQEKVNDKYVNLSGAIINNNGEYTFVAPENMTTNSKEYRVNIASKETPYIGVTLNIVVLTDMIPGFALRTNVYDIATNGFINSKSGSEDMHIEAESAAPIIVDLLVDGKSGKMLLQDYTMYKIVNGVNTKGTFAFDSNGDKLTIVLPENKSSDKEKYVLAIADKKNSEIKINLFISVLPEPDSGPTMSSNEHYVNVRAYPNAANLTVESLSVVGKYRYTSAWRERPLFSRVLSALAPIKDATGNYSYELNKIPVYYGDVIQQEFHLIENTPETTNKIERVEVDEFMNGKKVATYFYEYDPVATSLTNGFKAMKFLRKDVVTTP